MSITTLKIILHNTPMHNVAIILLVNINLRIDISATIEVLVLVETSQIINKTFNLMVTLILTTMHTGMLPSQSNGAQPAHIVLISLIHSFFTWNGLNTTLKAKTQTSGLLTYRRGNCTLVSSNSNLWTILLKNIFEVDWSSRGGASYYDWQEVSCLSRSRSVFRGKPADFGWWLLFTLWEMEWSVILRNHFPAIPII